MPTPKQQAPFYSNSKATNDFRYTSGSILDNITGDSKAGGILCARYGFDQFIGLAIMEGDMIIGKRDDDIGLLDDSKLFDSTRRELVYFTKEIGWLERRAGIGIRLAIRRRRSRRSWSWS